MHLRGRLLVATGLSVLAVAIGLNFQFDRTLRDFVLAETYDVLQRETRLAGTVVSRELAGDVSPEAADRVADLVGERLGVRVTLIRTDGVVVGDSRAFLNEIGRMDNHGSRPEVMQAVSEGLGRNVRHSATVGEDLVYVAGRVPDRNDGLLVRLSTPLRDIDRAQGQIRGAIGVSFLLGLAAVLVLSYGLTRVVTRQLSDMIAAARRLASGDYATRVDVGGASTTEIRELATVLNEMRLQTQERIGQVTAEISRLEAVLTSISEGIMVTERNGRVRLTNRQFDRLFAVAQDTEKLGRMPIELLRNAAVQEAVTRTLETSTGQVLEISLSGVLERYLDVHVAPIVQAGDCIGSVTVFYDITEIRRLEQVRKDFVANVSHELRTPLTTIKGCAATLAEGALEDAEAAVRFVDSINTHAERLHNLVDDLLDLSHLESEQLAINPEPIHINRLVRSAADTLQKTADDKRITLKLDVPDDLVLEGDRALVQQAVINLLDNALKYTGEDGAVTVGIERGPVGEHDNIPFASPETPNRFEEATSSEEPVRPRVRLEVRDNGAGIPSEDLPRIFERFYRVDRGRSRAMGGTGLGLAIVRHVAEAHGERVYVRSELGHGSTFGLTLPIFTGKRQSNEPLASRSPN